MLITVITPSYNQGNFIEDTIKSILNQDYPHLEYIIIDGGSTDNSVGIIKKYENKLSYWVSEKDEGQTHAINKGLKIAKGDIVTWINSDDQLTPNALSIAAKYFTKNPDAYLIHGKSYIKSSQTTIVKGANEQDSEARTLAGLPYPQPASFFRKQVVDLYGELNQHLHYGMDYDLLMRINLNHKVLSVPDIFSVYLLHDESKSTLQNEQFAKDWATVYSKFLVSILPSGKEYIETLKQLEIYSPSDDRYSVNKNIDKKTLDLSFGYFIANQIIFYFQAGNYKVSNRLLNYLKKNYQTIYNSENLSRTHFLTSPGINILESLKRKLKK